MCFLHFLIVLSNVTQMYIKAEKNITVNRGYFERFLTLKWWVLFVSVPILIQTVIYLGGQIGV